MYESGTESVRNGRAAVPLARGSSTVARRDQCLQKRNIAVAREGRMLVKICYIPSLYPATIVPSSQCEHSP